MTDDSDDGRMEHWYRWWSTVVRITQWPKGLQVVVVKPKLASGLVAGGQHKGSPHGPEDPWSQTDPEVSAELAFQSMGG